jgi:hypothetical protein
LKEFDAKNQGIERDRMFETKKKAKKKEGERYHRIDFDFIL